MMKKAKTIKNNNKLRKSIIAMNNEVETKI